jgi:hypothetical protein
MRAGIKLHLFTTCSPALRHYKTLYFDILRALRECQSLISTSDNLRGTDICLVGLIIVAGSHAAADRVSRLLMPLSTWLVVHRGDSPPVTPLSPSVAASPRRDASSSPPTETSQTPETSQTLRKRIRSPSAAAHRDPVLAPEELMPRTLLSLLWHRSPGNSV